MHKFGVGSAVVALALLAALSGGSVPDQQPVGANPLLSTLMSYSKMPGNLVSKRSHEPNSSDDDDYSADDDYSNQISFLSKDDITRNATTTVVRLNALADGMLEKLRQMPTHLLPVPLLPIRRRISLDFGDRHLRGMVRAPYGALTSVGDIARAGDITLIKENNTITLKSAFLFRDVEFYYKVYINFLNTFVFGSVNIALSDVFTRDSTKFVYINNTTCHFKVEDFELSFSEVKVLVDGKTEEETPLSYWLGAIVNYLQDDIRNGTLEMIYGDINKILTLADCDTLYQTLFPFDAPN